jgi:phosphopantetheine adenylyltransferase/dephospho-CoA kinase
MAPVGARLYIGVSGEALVADKAQKHNLQAFPERCAAVQGFMLLLGSVVSHLSTVNIHLVELEDAAGPAATDPSLQALVVSEETAAAATAINRQRQERGLCEVVLVQVPILWQTRPDGKREKVSSTWLRQMLNG